MRSAQVAEVGEEYHAVLVQRRIHEATEIDQVANYTLLGTDHGYGHLRRLRQDIRVACLCYGSSESLHLAGLRDQARGSRQVITSLSVPSSREA